jgi:hypothetical protein
MTTSLAAYIDMLFQWEYESASPELSTPMDRATHRTTHTFTDGTGSLQSNLLFHDRRRLTPASPTDLLDLAGGLTDVFGNALTFSYVKGIKIANKGVPNASPATAWTKTTGEDLEVGAGAAFMSSIWGGASSTGTEKLIVRSGGALVLTAPHDGYLVTATTADILRISLEGNGVNDVDYDIIIVGN